MGAFVNSHWGDLVALFILLVGVGVILSARGDTQTIRLGHMLIGAGLIALRLKTVTPGNGKSAD